MAASKIKLTLPPSPAWVNFGASASHALGSIQVLPVSVVKVMVDSSIACKALQTSAFLRKHLAF